MNTDCEVWCGVDGRGYDAHPQYGGNFLNLPLKSVYFGMPVIDNVFLQTLMSSLASSQSLSRVIISLRDTDSVVVTTDNCIYCRFFDQFYRYSCVLCDSVTALPRLSRWFWGRKDRGEF